MTTKTAIKEYKQLLRLLNKAIKSAKQYHTTMRYETFKNIDTVKLYNELFT
jgi:hypothetical protein